MVYETVTDLDQLLDRVKSYYADADLGLVRKAYEFSAKAHAGQRVGPENPTFNIPSPSPEFSPHSKRM